MKKLQKNLLGIFCLVLIGALIAGCGSSKSSGGGTTNPTPTPPSGDMVIMEINPTNELSALQALTLPATYKGFTFASGVAFDTSSAKSYSGNRYSGSYSGRIKLGGTEIGTNSITFKAKAGGKIDMLALSSKASDNSRHLMIAPISEGTPGTGVDLGTAPSESTLGFFTYNIPADGEYIIYSTVGGINIYFIHIEGIVDPSQEPSPSPSTEPSPSPSIEPSPSPSVEPSPSPSQGPQPTVLWAETFDNVPDGTNLKNAISGATLDNPQSFNEAEVSGTITISGGEMTMGKQRFAFSVDLSNATHLYVTIKNPGAVADLTLCVGDSYTTGGTVGSSGMRAHGQYPITNTSYEVLEVPLDPTLKGSNKIQFRGTVGTTGTEGLIVDKIEVVKK